ncbi:MAG: hypothetical protein U0414_33875 [Polyangiaceae bacterium]
MSRVPIGLAFASLGLASCGSRVTAVDPPVASAPAECAADPAQPVAVTPAEERVACTPDGWCWSYPPLGGNDLSGVWTDGDRAIAVGDRGAILSYDGRRWSAAREPSGADLFAVWGRASDDVFAVGRGVFHFDGRAWSKLASSDFPLGAVTGVEGSKDVFVGGSGALFHFDGATWTTVSSPFDPLFTALYAVSTKDVFIGASNGGIFRFDGESIRGMYKARLAVVSMVGRSATDVYAASGEGLLHFDGASWTVLPGTEGSWASVGFDGADVMAVDDSGKVVRWSGEKIVREADGCGPILGAGGAGRARFAVGRNGAIHRLDGGAWRADANRSPALEAVWGSGNDDIYAVGGAGAALHFDGAAWSELATGTVEDLTGVWGSSASDVWITGQRHTLLHFDGHALKPVDTPSTEAFESVWGTGPTDVFVGTRGGHVLHFDGTVWRDDGTPQHDSIERGVALFAPGKGPKDAGPMRAFAITSKTALAFDGTSWTTQASSLGSSPRSIWAEASRLWVVDSAGSVFASWGGAWESVREGDRGSFNDLCRASNGALVAVGRDGRAIASTGGDWTELATGTGADLRAIWCRGTAVYAVGAAGVLTYQPPRTRR